MSNTIRLNKYLNTTQVNERLGYLLSIQKIKELGIEPVVETGVGCYWEPGIVPHIGLAMIRDLSKTVGEYA